MKKNLKFVATTVLLSFTVGALSGCVKDGVENDEKFYDNLEKVVVTKTVTTSVTKKQSREADLYQKASIVKTETENSMNAKGYKMIDSEETIGNYQYGQKMVIEMKFVRDENK